MDINQLVSFVDYQLGQKQGWENLSQVLHIVKDSQELVTKAQHEVEASTKAVEDMKLSLAAMDETAKAKVKDLEAELQAVRDKHQTALKTHEVALGREINDKTAQVQALDESIAKSLKTLESLNSDQKLLEAKTAEAVDKYKEIQGKLAAIKGSL